ncbi:hypothetical protein MES5069_620161 [Mesorhizobium escarrei]|uniref:Uncharacterized protein n=1 Tax=Mesorhizobium escarrei TaxID=666018 RepID=A0ABM9EEZ6_9HYPH|nr:hypothetical protein MES5069_620161 [Mesorhizobium escarrei]
MLYLIPETARQVTAPNTTLAEHSGDDAFCILALVEADRSVQGLKHLCTGAGGPVRGYHHG